MTKKLFSFFLHLSKREKIILYAAVFFVFLTLSDRLILEPILSKMKALDEEIRNQKNRIKKSLHILAQKDRIKKEVDSIAPYVTSAKSSEEETVLILQEIEEMANAASVYVIDIKSAGLKEGESFKKYLVKLNCEAQMEQLTQLFYDIESSAKLLKIEKYDIRPKTAGSSVLRCTMTISKALMP